MLGEVMLMRSLDRVTKVLSLYEVKACYDIALIRLHTHLDMNDQLRVDSNIYRFIYGDSKNGEASANTLNYRYRSVEDLTKTYKAFPKDSYLDIVEKDIINCYKTFFAGYYTLHKTTPRYGGSDITENMLLEALKMTRREVTKIVMKLFHGETIYTLLLETPIGKDGLYKRATGKFYGSYKDDIGDIDYVSFHDFLIRKNSRIQSMDLYVDIQGLVFHCLGQYFSEVKRNPSIQQKYALYSVRDVETSKGTMDKSSRDLLEMKYMEVPNYSLTKLFNMCKELDSILFTKRNTSTFCYSILEWFADYISLDIKQYIQSVQNTNKLPQFTSYQDSFENTVLLKKTPIIISDDFTAKIEAAKKVFTELYENWYMQKTSSIERSKINRLCELCESEYVHCLIDYNSNTHWGSKKKKTHGVLDVSNVSDNQGVNHYINLEYYTKVPEDLRENYTSIKPEEVAIYTDPYLQANVKDDSRSFIKRGKAQGDSTELKYVLLPAGWARIQQILAIFQEFDELLIKLDKAGATVQEVLPAYYNNIPCTLDGALNYVLQEKRVAVFDTTNNPLFDGNLLHTCSETLEEATTFDWSLPKWFKEPDSRGTGVDMDLVKTTTNLCGLGKDHYPRYLESILFGMVSQAFPRSIADNGTCYYFTEEITESLSSEEIGVYGGTDYTKLMTRFGCVYPEKKMHTDFKMQETNIEQTNLFNDEFMQLLQDTGLGGNLDEIFETLDNFKPTEYKIDLRKEFFTENNANSLYTLTLLAMLLCNEFATYKTNNYSCDYVGLNQATKKTWTSRVNKTFVNNFKELHTETVRDLGPRVEDVITKIAGAFQNIFNEDPNLGALRDESKFILANNCKAMDVIDIICRNLLVNESLCIPALAELAPDVIKKRLLEAKTSLKPFTYYGRNYIPVIASVDMIIFNGERYHVEVKDSYMYAVPRNPENNKLFKVYLDGQSLPGIHFDEGWKRFFKVTQNNGAIRYLYQYWETKVRELVSEMCKNTFTETVIPITFTTKSVWQLVRYMFCKQEINEIGFTRPITVKETNVPDCSNYTDPVYAPSAIITEVCRQVTNINGEIEEVFEYYWTLDDKYPVALDYLVAWNNSTMFLEAFADVHQLSYTLHKVAVDPKYRYDKEYKDYLCQGFAALLWEQSPKADTAVGHLDLAAMMAVDTDTAWTDVAQESYSPYRPIRWDNPMLIGDKFYNQKCKQLSNLQSEGVRHFINADNIAYHTGTSYVCGLPELLRNFKHKLDDIQSKSLFPVKGVDDLAADADEKMKIYNMHRDAIKRFVDEHRTSLNAMRIGTEKSGRSLQSERFYRVNNWIRDPETGILCKLSGVPYMIMQGNLVGFLYHIGYWICIDRKNPENITYKVYEELR